VSHRERKIRGERERERERAGLMADTIQ